jgi:hypothetical protein
VNWDEQSTFDWAKDKRDFYVKIPGGLFKLGGQMGLISPLD